MKKIILITGCMFSGKTKLLLSMYLKSLNLNINSLLIKPDIDNRYSNNTITTHDKVLNVNCNTVDYNKPHKIINLVNKQDYKKIFIDEIQFFNEDIYLIIGKLSIKYDLIVSGLTTDFKKDSFKNTKFISDIATEIINLPSICNICGDTAFNNQRLVKTEKGFIPANKNEPVIVIGGNDIYEPRCNNCFKIF